jgi:hypothetical protein
MTPKSQAVRGVVSSYKALLNVFERIHFFLQRLNSYTRIPLTNDFTELLGKIMAQILFILALSTKAMTEGRIKQISESVCSSYFYANHNSD